MSSQSPFLLTNFFLGLAIADGCFAVQVHMMAMMSMVCSAHMQVEMLNWFTLQNVKELEEDKEKISVEEGRERQIFAIYFLLGHFFKTVQISCIARTAC